MPRSWLRSIVCGSRCGTCRWVACPMPQPSRRCGAWSGRPLLSRTEIVLPELGEPISHYTHAVRFDSLLFISGIAPVHTLEADVVAQAEDVLAQLGAVLAHVGLSAADVLKVT